MKAPEMKSGQMLTVAYLIALLIVLFIVYKVLGKIGLIKTAAKKREEKAETKAEDDLRTDPHFDPYYIKDKIGKYRSIGQTKANLAATYVHDSIYGLFKAGTNAEKIFSTFATIYNKCNVSEISLAYAIKYSRDMRADLLNNLNDAHKLDLAIIISKKPEL